MNKIKEFIKKYYLILLIIVFAVIAITMGILLFLKNDETKTFKENTYTMYVDTDPMIKFTVKESFYECTKKHTTTICSEIKTEVIDYQMMEEGTNTTDFKGLTFPQAMAKLIEFDASKPFTITTNYEITREQLKEQILNYTAQKEFDIIVHFEKELYEQDILEKPKDTYYTITFDSDGGNNIDSIVVKEGEIIKKPDNPTKNGYTFKEWQVENTSFDFTTKIYKNTTLKAIWEKKESSTTTPPTSNPTPAKKDTINLNENVVVTEYTKSIYEECSFYVFATNLKQLFPKAENHWCPFPKEQCFEEELAVDDYNANFNSIQFDTAKEQEVINLLKKYKNGNYAGIVVNSYNLNNQHFLTMDYKYLQIQDTYYIEGTDAAKKIQNLLKSATRLYGNCGATDFSSTKVLTEELCNEYHLKCDRW